MRHQDIEEACECIDAGFFSGDAFHDPGSLKEIEEYMGRWAREITSIKEPCEHGNGWNDYCLPCGRVNGGA